MNNSAFRSWGDFWVTVITTFLAAIAITAATFLISLAAAIATLPLWFWVL